MTAGKWLNLQAEEISRYPTLELVGKKPVITACQYRGRDIRPAGQRKADPKQ